MKPIDCETAERFVSDHLAGDLPDASQNALGEHLKSCEACRARTAAIFKQDRALSEFSAQSRLPALKNTIHQTLLGETRTMAAPQFSRPRRRKSGIRKTRSGGFLFPLLAAASVCAVVGLFAYQRAQKSEPALALLASFDGSVAVVRDGQTLEVTPSLELRAGDTLTIAAASQALLSFAGETTSVRLDSDTTVRVDKRAPGKRVHLSSGALSASVSVQPPGEPFVFTSSLARAEVIGTKLSFKATAAEARLDVTEGKVRLIRESDRATVDVSASFFAVASASGTLAALPLHAPETVAQEKQQRKRIITTAQQQELQKIAQEKRASVVAATAKFTEHTSQGPRGTMRYRLFTPQGATGLKHPVVLYLHGTGGGGRDNKKQLEDQPFGAGLWALPENQQKFPCFVIAPQTAGGWEGNAHQLALQVLDDVMKSNPVEPTRIYVTGLSAGGFGVFACLQARPRQFAAGLAISGWLPDPAKIPTYAHVPVWLMHGANDTVIQVVQSRRAYDLLAKEKADVRYDEFENAQHGIFAQAYNLDGVIEWFQERPQPAADGQ